MESAAKGLRTDLKADLECKLGLQRSWSLYSISSIRLNESPSAITA